jgi:molecular chaperone GrpE
MEENKLKAEEYYSNLQRLKAEFDNFRKRTIKEKEETAKYASERIVVALLPVVDNLERAIESSENNKDFDSFSKGVAMIQRQLQKVLENEGLKVIFY